MSKKEKIRYSGQRENHNLIIADNREKILNPL